MQVSRNRKSNKRASATIEPLDVTPPKAFSSQKDGTYAETEFGVYHAAIRIAIGCLELSHRAWWLDDGVKTAPKSVPGPETGRATFRFRSAREFFSILTILPKNVLTTPLTKITLRRIGTVA